MEHLGSLQHCSAQRQRTVHRRNLVTGINDTGEHLIRIREDGSIAYVIDKVCDHAGGRLILKEGKAICPIHGWQLDLDELRYDQSHVRKKPSAYDLDDEGNIVLIETAGHLTDPFKGAKKGSARVRWLNHAAVHIECNGTSFVTDPWLFGPAFMTGWWLSAPSPADSVDLLKKADHIFLSHNHPDHLHAETLAVLPRDKPLLVADFKTRSCEKYLRALGFTNIQALPFKEVFKLGENFHISALKSGDFRDDSGLYISANGHSFLLTVDCNFLNNHILPRDLDLLMTSFAGGASGFPLCFEDYSADEKRTILERNKASIRFLVSQYLKTTRPAHYMPYAGMFIERAARDTYIREHNAKNTVADYAALARANGAELIHPANDRHLVFSDGTLTMEKMDPPVLAPEDPLLYLTALSNEYPFDTARVIDYLKRSGFHDDQIVYIIPTDDAFEPTGDPVILANFQRNEFRCVTSSEIIPEVEGMRVMRLRVRPEVLMCVVENQLPWEDLSIGFQMRVARSPNTYESEFWYHFTNVYIAEHHFRYSSFCGACTVIDHNPIWAAARPERGPC